MMLVALVMSVGVISSCGNDDDVEPATLTLSTSSLDFSASGGTASVNVISNTNWNITGSNEWCKALITSGQGNSSVIINVEVSNTAESRENKLTFYTQDGTVSQSVTVKQSGMKLSLSVSPAKISFLSNANEHKTITINATGKWTIENKDNVDWLNYDSEGEGNTTLDIATKSINESSKARTANLIVKLTSDENVNQTITITQDPLYSDVCVKPSDWVAVYDELYELFEISCEYVSDEKSSEANQFRYLLLPESDLKYWTKKEIRDALEKQDLLKYSYGYLTTLVVDSNDDWLTGNTTYRFMSLAYDENGNAGDVYEETIKTPSRLNATDDAYISYSNLSLTDNGFTFYASPEGRTRQYHIIYGNNNKAINLAASYAFQINYYLKYKKKHWFTDNWKLTIETNYPNAHQFYHSSSLSLSSNSTITAWGWGVFENGNRSTCLTGFDIDLTSTEVSKPKKVNSKKEKAPKSIAKKCYNNFLSDVY